MPIILRLPSFRRPHMEEQLSPGDADADAGRPLKSPGVAMRSPGAPMQAFNVKTPGGRPTGGKPGRKAFGCHGAMYAVAAILVLLVSAAVVLATLHMKSQAARKYFQAGQGGHGSPESPAGGALPAVWGAAPQVERDPHHKEEHFRHRVRSGKPGGGLQWPGGSAEVEPTLTAPLGEEKQQAGAGGPGEAAPGGAAVQPDTDPSPEPTHHKEDHFRQRLWAAASLNSVQAAGGAAVEAAGQGAGQDAGQGAGLGAGQAADQEAGQAAGQEAGQEAGQAAALGAGQAADQEAGQAVGQAAGQEAGQAAAQEAGQAAGQAGRDVDFRYSYGNNAAASVSEPVSDEKRVVGGGDAQPLSGEGEPRAPEVVAETQPTEGGVDVHHKEAHFRDRIASLRGPEL